MIQTNTSSTPTLLVLAAGMGSRYGGLKQIDSVGPTGETIIDYSVFDALRAGFGKLVFVIRRDIEAQFREVVGARFERRVAVEYVYQELDNVPPGFAVPVGRTKPWGTTHAILMAAAAVREPFAVINADDFYGQQAYSLMAQHLSSGSPDYAMVGFILRNTLSDFGTVSRGVCRLNGRGYLESVEELTKIERVGAAARNLEADGKARELTGDEIVSMNFWGFTPAVFDQLREGFRNFLGRSANDLKAECYIPSTISALIGAGQARLKVLRTADSWFGVTYREDRPRVVECVQQLVRSGAYPDSLWKQS